MTTPSVLLIHSGGFTSRQWRRLSDGLAPTYRVIAPDLLGYGSNGSWPMGKPFHFQQDVTALAELIANEPLPVHVVGHSYGGLLALHLALQKPHRVRSLALFEPVAFGVLDRSQDADAHAELAQVSNTYVADADGADERWLSSFVDWWNGPGTWSRLAPETKRGFCQVGWKLFQEVMSLAEDRTDCAAFSRITVPVLLMGGEQTRMAEKRVLENVSRCMARARLKLFPEMGHMGPVTHAAQVNAAVIEHLRTIQDFAASSSSPE